MQKKCYLPPSARLMFTLMRDIGYAFETAIADIIDNSIAANATNIKICCEKIGKEYVIGILDNGEGMDSKGIIDAMRYGGKTERRERSSHDLGRFGLGLKTASFSQCRNLTGGCYITNDKISFQLPLT